ncbi:hypothetical protein nbrc107696_02010 [Gordonia spumicola]|uniref:Uncharacterized protein n=1 Tax=Gordonia spumicola TaxID=589161 RepID=A0A7I9V2X4_9ACTN|nr:hypothetical protein [Gordonia spumicola]GED99754.1 hypothetical protein nbrc107696_02010 [Gordonia spumicola]
MTASNKAAETTATDAKVADAVITDFLTTVIESTRDLVDNLLESAGTVERNVRERADDAREKLTGDDAVDALRTQIQNLSDQVEKFANLRLSSEKKADADK